ncbi:MAG TPA: transglutaminase-like domain-containing protein [Verrucomicrobiae bacterium]|nr:transglutaminase-like domain-containing protein [Verrucomicrobiae bacterium]
MFIQKARRCYTLLFAFLIICSMPPTLSADTKNGALTKATLLEVDGHFIAASNVLNTALAETSPGAQHKQIEFELDRLNRICQDFSLSQDDLFQALQQSVSGLTTNEFEQWVREGRFDSRVIDGRRWFMRASVSNLYFRYPDLYSRRMDGGDRAKMVNAFLASCRAIKQAALSQGSPYVLPKRFDITMTVSASPDVVSNGQIIRAWLPIPRNYPYQTNFEIISSSPPVKELAPADSSIRSAYFEQTAQAGQSTDFKIHYRYTRYGVSFDIDPKRVTPFDGTDPAIVAYTREAPHVVFTPEMRALSQKIGGGEKNPALLAKKFYDWIGENVYYSYAIEYSTIRNISDYCRSRGYGDCGQEALYFMTLCRLNGIPARWQSGWHTFPGVMSIHDWTEIYLAPYGWVPVDPYMSVMAGHYATMLPLAERHEIRDFYFGGLDQWRMAANDDHSQTLSPPKNTFRSDNVDFQRAELESGAQNLYFNQFSYSFDVKELPAGQTASK